jgi:hypothetical protein
MEKYFKIIVYFIFTGLFLFSSTGSLPPIDDTPVALVKKIVRDVSKRVTTDEDWELAKTGEPLYNGGEVRTGENSLALILFTDGSGLLRVRENSIANIYGQRKDKEMDKNTFIQRGEIGFNVNKQSENEEFTFTTPTMVASIRGTAGLIKVTDLAGVNEGLNTDLPTVRSTLILEEGEVEVKSTKGDEKTATVTAGQALISDDKGTLETAVQSESQKNTLQRSKGTKLKTVRFTVDGVTYEVEYYSEEE